MILTAGKAASYLGVSYDTFRRVYSPFIPTCQPPGTKWKRYDTRDIDKALAACKTPMHAEKKEEKKPHSLGISLEEMGT